MEKPLPLKPKLTDGVSSTPNTYAYLTKNDRVWLAGLFDGVGKIFNGRILKTTNAQKLISYRVSYTSTTLKLAGLTKAAELLGLKLSIHGSKKSRVSVVLPEDRVDDFMAVIKPYVSADQYNKYVRAKYLSELSAFKLGRETYNYDTGKPRMMFKGIDWQQVDELLAQPDITPGMINSITNARIATQKLITE